MGWSVTRTRLPRESITAPSLLELKKHMNDTAKFWIVLRKAEVDLMIPMGPFQFEIYYDCVILSFLDF